MSWPQSLLQLQELDQALAEQTLRLREIEAQLGDDAALASAEREAAAREAAAEAARQAQRTLEFEVNQVQVKRELAEKNLYSGRITNARELQDLQAELKSLRRRVAALEDELLEAMLAREEADAAAQEAAAQLARRRAGREAAQAELLAEREALEAANAELRTRRETLTAQLPPAVLESYIYLWDRTGGIPVAQLKGQTCGVCGTDVLKPTQQKVQRGQEAYCDTCRRLLVA